MYTYKELFVDKIFGELISHKIINYDELLKISIMLTNRCNYSCNYCISNIPNTKDKYDIKKEYLNLFFKHLKKSKFDKKFRVNFLGGEPTLYKDIYYVIDSILNNYSETILKILTNGSASVDYYNSLTNKYNIKLDISYHPQYANDQHFIDIIKMMKEKNNNNYLIDILLVYEYYDKIEAFVNRLNTEIDNCNIFYVLLANVDYVNTKYNIFNKFIYSNSNLNSERYILTFEKKELILSLCDVSSFNSNGRNIFKGMQCDIYNNQWNIINNCITTICSNNKPYILLPNGINKFIDDYNKYSNGITCIKDYCNCDCMINTYKHR